MPYIIENTMRQIQNVLIRGEDGRSSTLTLLPKGRHGSVKEIPDSAMSPDLRMRESKKYVRIREKQQEG